jgi:hypothetical protein
MRRAHWIICVLLAACVAPVPAAAAPLSLLDVPFISQSESLCGGAAAAMVLRYWGARGVDAETFAPLVDRSSAGIKTTVLVDDLIRRGWMVVAASGTDDLLTRELTAGRPVLALIQDRPHRFHYIVIVGATERAIVFHDPARASFRVMTRATFADRWAATGRWLAIVTPANHGEHSSETVDAGRAGAVAGARSGLYVEANGDAAPGLHVEANGDARPGLHVNAAGNDARSDPPAALAQMSCDALVSEGVTRAQANDLPSAEAALTHALGCPGAAAPRELAGVRALQRRWADAAELARTALAVDPHDDYAWQVLGTSEFVQDAPLDALDAWNEVGQPHVDLVRIDGLTRTRQRVVEALIGTKSPDLLTRSTLLRARRRLGELPSATATRLTYAPVGSGLVELRGTIVERPVVPHDPWSLASVALSAASSRSASFDLGSLSGGGESATVMWRFWPHRPLFGIGLTSPAPFGGTWRVEGFSERQPFDRPSIATSHRTSARLEVANWLTGRTRVSLRAGADRWDGLTGTMANVGAGLRMTSASERADLRIDGDAWPGGAGFALGGARMRWRSSTARSGTIVIESAAATVASAGAPADLWPGGDIGSARPTLLRAHPLITDGALRVVQLGRAIVQTTTEAQHWWRSGFGTSLGVAAFVDAARTMHRLDLPARDDADVGAGVRLSVLSVPGVVRIDIAHGLRDGDDAISFIYTID